MTVVFILIALILLLFSGIPVAFALGGLGLALIILGDMSPVMIPQGLYSVVDNFVLLAIPLFLLMSNVLLKGGIGTDLFNAIQSWVGHWPGGLGIATIISCGVFAAISGSSVATAATIGNVAIDEMRSRGYRHSFVLGLVAAGGTLGILIPPSIPMIIYGVVTEESIVDLFLAGLVPGLMLASLFMLFCFIYSRFSDSYTPTAKASWSDRRRTTLRALPTVLLASIVIGGIYLGVFTPTESAAIGFAVSLIIVFFLKTMTWAQLKEAVIESMKTTVTIFLIVGGAKVFGMAITLYRIPQDISMVIGNNFTEIGMFVLVVCLVLLLIGLFLDALAMLLIMMPVLYPSILSMGIDPIWFGIIFVIMIECALITPPVGMNLFVIQAVGNAPLLDVIKGVWPFTLIMLLSALVVYLLPDIALYIPYKL